MRPDFEADFFADPQDPIARERRMRARTAYISRLFHPIYEELHDDIDWLVKDLIPTGYFVLLAGQPKSGKTCLATALALSVANGLPFAGHPVQQGAVLWISAEESVRERHLLLTSCHLAEASTPFYTCYERLPLDQEGTWTDLQQWVHETEAKLIVIDPIIACAGRSLTDSWAVRRTLQDVKTFAAIHNVAILGTHHLKRDRSDYNKARVADNAQIAATASMNIILSSTLLTHPMGEVATKEPEGVLGQDPPGGPSPAAPLRCGGRSVNEVNSGGGAPLTIDHQPSTNPAIKQSSNRAFRRSPRIVSLDCNGRGEFANQAIRLVSYGPLDYHPTIIQDHEPIKPTLHVADTEQAVLEALKDGPKAAVDIVNAAGRAVGTIRNALTSLRRKGLVRMIRLEGKRRHYERIEEPEDVEPTPPIEETRPLERITGDSIPPFIVEISKLERDRLPLPSEGEGRGEGAQKETPPQPPSRSGRVGELANRGGSHGGGPRSGEGAEGEDDLECDWEEDQEEDQEENQEENQEETQEEHREMSNRDTSGN